MAKAQDLLDVCPHAKAWGYKIQVVEIQFIIKIIPPSVF